MTEDEKYTTISLKQKTKERLERIGNKGDEWDELLNRLCDYWERYKDVVDQRK